MEEDIGVNLWPLHTHTHTHWQHTTGSYPHEHGFQLGGKTHYACPAVGDNTVSYNTSPRDKKTEHGRMAPDKRMIVNGKPLNQSMINQDPAPYVQSSP